MCSATRLVVSSKFLHSALGIDCFAGQTSVHFNLWLSRDRMSNFVFSRRSLQASINYLSGVLDSKGIQSIVDRLNRVDEHRLPAMWELVFLEALSRITDLKHEITLSSGRRPDFELTVRVPTQPPLLVIGDITTISDVALHEENPVRELSTELSKAAMKLGLGPSHFSYDIRGGRLGKFGNGKMSLFLPDKNNISKFFKKNIYPWLVELTKLPGLRDKFEYKQGRTHIILTYHPDTHNGSGSYTSYDVAASRGKNPLYNALKGKKNQLRGAPIDALRLVVVCDGDCSLLRRGSSLMTGETYSSTQVTKDFLRLNSSIDAVLLVTIDEHRAFLAHKVTCSLKYELVTADSYQKSPRLTEQSVKAIYDLLDGAIKTMPTPLRSAYSAAALCLRSEIGPDRIGGYTLQGNDITISSRALQRLLAGEISSEEFIRQHRWDGDEPNPFDRTFKFGQLISAVKVVNGKDLDDDSLTFSFGWPDPAASPFIVMTSQDED